MHQALAIIYSCIVPPSIGITYERVNQTARTSTAGLLTYDLLRCQTPTKKALLVIPGVCGNSREAYVMDTVTEAHRNGFNVLVVNPICPPKDDPAFRDDVGLESCDFSNNIYI